MSETTKDAVPEGPKTPPVQQDDDAQRRRVEEEIRTVKGSCHTPIVNEHHFGRLHVMHRKTHMRPWVARVFVLGNGRIVEFGRDKQPTAGELLWGGYRAMFEVDRSLRRLGLEITLPSAGDAFVFRATVDVQWRVAEPKSVVRAGVTDIRDVMVPPLLDGLRRATRVLLADEVEAAEKTANAQYEHNWLPEEYGLWTNVLVRLRMDAQKEDSVRLAAEVQAYKTLIEAGDLDQFALQIARNPDQVADVVQVLVRERDTHRREVCEFITQLLDSDALDRCQIEDKVRVTLQWMGVSINRVLTGTDSARPDPFVERPLRAGGTGLANGEAGGV
jgi:hypothetical protein